MRARIILIHGLNNNLDAFRPLQEKLSSMEYDCVLMCLPGHGENRHESRDLKGAFQYFDKNLKELLQEPCFIVAFSQGGLFLQLWLETNSPLKPKAQVLLAPALYIRKFDRLKQTMQILPAILPIVSLLPKALRRYRYLNVWEYRTLFEAALKFRSNISSLKIPTHIIVDPLDEVVDAQKLELEFTKKEQISFEYFKRPYLKGKRPGKYHILFHPDYFSPDDWDRFTLKIDDFFKKHS